MPRGSYAVSVHYRNVADDDLPTIEAAVERALAEQPTLRRDLPPLRSPSLRFSADRPRPPRSPRSRFPGKKVVELRPDFVWNKGKAVEFILGELEARAGDPVFPIYLGDDVSDEDAFRAVRDKGGLAILVRDANVAREETAAAYRLRSPKQVVQLLSQLLPPAAAD